MELIVKHVIELGPIAQNFLERLLAPQGDTLPPQQPVPVQVQVQVPTSPHRSILPSTTPRTPAQPPVQTTPPTKTAETGKITTASIQSLLPQSRSTFLPETQKTAPSAPITKPAGTLEAEIPVFPRTNNSAIIPPQIPTTAAPKPIDLTPPVKPTAPLARTTAPTRGRPPKSTAAAPPPKVDPVHDFDPPAELDPATGLASLEDREKIKLVLTKLLKKNAGVEARDILLSEGFNVQREITAEKVPVILEKLINLANVKGIDYGQFA